MLRTRCILNLMSFIIIYVGCQMEPLEERIKKFPHSVYLLIIQADGGWSCGGSILTENIILTAAYCVADNDVKDVTAFVGHAEGRFGDAFSVRQRIVHEKFNGRYADIALLDLATSLTFGPTVKRVAIMRNPPYYQKAQVTGWGNLNEKNKTISDVLLYGDQYIVSNCAQIYDTKPEGIICATEVDPGVFTGSGGSGLLVQGYIQIGIVSYAFDFNWGLEGVTFYTNTTTYLDWIQNQIANLRYC